MAITSPKPTAPASWAAHALLLSGLLGLVPAFHIVTHIVSALGRWIGRYDWVDAVHLSTALGTLYWIPPTLLALGLARSGMGATHPERRGFGSFDVLIGAGIALAAFGIRAAPLLADPWLKPEYDEGVYLGGAWLLSNGALPYRDWVFAHLPGSLAMLQPAAAAIELGQNNTLALQLARLTACLADALAAGLVYCAARQLTAVPGALLAALVYAVDSRAIEFSRQLLLEPLQAPWLAGGAALLLAQLSRPERHRRLGLLAGLLMAGGISIKLTGALVPLAAVLALAVARRWRVLGDLAAGAALGAVLSCGWSVWVSGDEIVRQTVLLQAARGNSLVFDHWAWLMGDYTAAFTAFVAWLGALALVSNAWRGRVAPGWTFVLLWLALVYLLFAIVPSFYDHYYDKLLMPAAILAAASAELFARRRAWLAPLVLMAAPLLAGQARQWSVVDRAPTWRPAVERLSAGQPEQPVLTLEPILNVLGGRPIVKPPGGPYLLDMFLGEPYLNSPLNRRWPDAAEVRAAALAASDSVLLASNDLGRFGPLEREFDCQPADAYGNLHYCRRYGLLATLQHETQLELLEVVDSKVVDQAGQRWLGIQLRWRARATPPQSLALALHLLDGSGKRVAQLDVPASGGIEWQPEGVTTQEYRLPLPAQLPPGVYSPLLIVYRWDDGQPLAFTPANGAAPATAFTLPPVSVP